ncbi:AraC family transcriptional regulator [Streptococcus respiraculi]|uniref:AraC family transcriptional regulator n=1 Tax=Streptococcus respiraculi TaxID=2021971 RepID=UPI000E744BE1|nr:AraC family transcriptional regulator [Streptococcus respiraculi]
MANYSRYIKDNPSGFPYHYEKMHLMPQDSDIMYHGHPELEMIYVQKGSAYYHIHAEAFASSPGDIILIQPTFLHAIKPIAGKEQQCQLFRIDLDNLGRSHIELFSQRYIQPIYTGHFHLTTRIQPTMPGYEEIKGCLLAIFALVHDQSLYYDVLLKSKLYEFFYLLFKYRHVNRHYSDETYHKYQKLRDLIQYIDDHLAEPLTIDALADYFGYSRNHFMSIFKQHTGSSCGEFILQKRLNKACELLIQTMLPIAEIAPLAGFDNLSNFNRHFKRRFQLTPRQYRKRKGVKQK